MPLDAALKTAPRTTFSDMSSAPTRGDAVAKILSGETSLAVHDHGVNPMIYRAAQELISLDDTGKKTDIEGVGYPYDVLESISRQLHDIGASNFVSQQILGALEEYAINLGADFAREAKAKPLYARVMVTDKKPDDLAEGELVQFTFLTAKRRLGSGASQRIMQSTIYGTKTSMSQEVDIKAVFEMGKEKGVMIYFASPSVEALKGFSHADMAMLNLMQGMGGSMDAGSMKQIRDMILNGELKPEALALIASVAELARLKEAMLTPGAVDKPDAAIKMLMDTIVEQVKAGIESGALPPALVKSTLAVMIETAQSIPSNNFAELIQNLSAGNDNVTLAADVTAVIEQLEILKATEGLDAATRADIEKMIAEVKAGMADTAANPAQVLSALTAQLSELSAREGMPAAAVEQLSAILPQAQSLQATAQAMAVETALPAAEKMADMLNQIVTQIESGEVDINNLPPEMQNLIDKLGGIEGIKDAMAQETSRAALTAQIADAIKGQGEPALAAAVQATIVSLSSPDVQSALPPAMQAAAAQVMTELSKPETTPGLPPVIQVAAAAFTQDAPTQNMVADIRAAIETLPPSDPRVTELTALLTKVQETGAAGLPRADADRLTNLVGGVPPVGPSTPPGPRVADNVLTAPDRAAPDKNNPSPLTVVVGAGTAPTSNAPPTAPPSPSPSGATPVTNPENKAGPSPAPTQGPPITPSPTPAPPPKPAETPQKQPVENKGPDSKKPAPVKPPSKHGPDCPECREAFAKTAGNEGQKPKVNPLVQIKPDGTIGVKTYPAGPEKQFTPEQIAGLKAEGLKGTKTIEADLKSSPTAADIDKFKKALADAKEHICLPGCGHDKGALDNGHKHEAQAPKAIPSSAPAATTFDGGVKAVLVLPGAGTPPIGLKELSTSVDNSKIIGLDDLGDPCIICDGTKDCCKIDFDKAIKAGEKRASELDNSVTSSSYSKKRPPEGPKAN